MIKSQEEQEEAQGQGGYLFTKLSLHPTNPLKAPDIFSPETHRDERNHQGYPMSKERRDLESLLVKLTKKSRMREENKATLLPLKVAATSQTIQPTSGLSEETCSRVQNLH
eukprot:1344095-Amorphochlora_amoeboformis.AAC.1